MEIAITLPRQLGEILKEPSQNFYEAQMTSVPWESCWGTLEVLGEIKGMTEGLAPAPMV
ncbi:hypothetical protein [Candidatus Alkanophaga liquidiphilum]|nr:hypothetical protein [Candidatus Alkanophaga liquidiphilum]